MLKVRKKAYKGVAMEGVIATWYARTAAKDRTAFADLARTLAARVAPGSRVLEVAPGPGYLAIELARLGVYRIEGLDISCSFVRMASENAARAGIAAQFHHGDAAHMPFAAGSFDFIVCRAAFKNFAEPVAALREVHRVLRPGGEALIVDMRRDASDAAIDDQVRSMGLGRVDALLSKGIFKYVLRKSAYSREDFVDMVSATPFGRCEITEFPLGFEIWLRK